MLCKKTGVPENLKRSAVSGIASLSDTSNHAAKVTRVIHYLTFDVNACRPVSALCCYYVIEICVYVSNKLVGECVF